MDVKVLEEAAGVVLLLDRQLESAAHARIDAVGRDQVLAADTLLLVAPVAVHDARDDAMSILGEIVERRVVFDARVEPGRRVLADDALGLTLIVRHDAVVPRVDGRVVETGAYLGAPAVTDEVHHVSLAPDAPLENTSPQVPIHEV